MAIYHLSVKLISRASGSSALAAAAYRSAGRLYDQRLDRHHDFSNKAGVVHSEVMLPDGALEEWADREKLWNAVEAAEVRKDAQLAREVEFALPRELTQADGIALAREFVAQQFVAKGMVADLNVHWELGSDGEPRPHAHAMLTTRRVGEDGFGPKERDWNRTDLLEQWCERWDEHVNQRLAERDIDARIDHRSLEAQASTSNPSTRSVRRPHADWPKASRLNGSTSIMRLREPMASGSSPSRRSPSMPSPISNRPLLGATSPGSSIAIARIRISSIRSRGYHVRSVLDGCGMLFNIGRSIQTSDGGLCWFGCLLPACAKAVTLPKPQDGRGWVRSFGC
jgi:hypothetical protein